MDFPDGRLRRGEAMNRVLSAAVAALLLSACDKPVPAPTEPTAPIEPTAPTTPAASEAPAPAAPAAPATDPVTPAATNEPPGAAAATTVPAADAAGDQAVNDRIDNVLGDHAQYQAAVARLQQAVAAGDGAAVAAMVDYPFNATIDGNKTMVKNADAFVAQYDKIVTPAIADAIVRQKYSELMVNAKGVMFGSGEAWLNGICKDQACKAFEVKVVAIQPGA
jgi:hypothetical protein